MNKRPKPKTLFSPMPASSSVPRVVGEWNRLASLAEAAYNTADFAEVVRLLREPLIGIKHQALPISLMSLITRCWEWFVDALSYHCPEALREVPLIPCPDALTETIPQFVADRLRILGDYRAYHAFKRWKNAYVQVSPKRRFEMWDGSPSPASDLFDVPNWRGEPLSGKCILVVDSAGFGDALQCLRYPPLLRLLPSSPSRVIAAIRPAFVALVEANASRLGIDQVLPFPGPEVPTAGADYAQTVGGLVLYLPGCESAATTPKEAYLFAPVGEHFRQYSGLRVGLTWASGAFSRGGKELFARDIPACAFAPLAQVPGISLFSLQKGPTEADYKQIPGCVSLSGEIRDWSDTAAMLADMDLLISCDTGIVHLAGAMGKPVLMLLPSHHCHRWGVGETALLYPSVRCYRQRKPGEWGTVVRQVVSDLIAGTVHSLAGTSAV